MARLVAALLLALAAFGQSNSGYTITTAAGTYAGTGDGGPATSATLAIPYSVAVDASGNLYIADYGNEAIRRVEAATGIITTISTTQIAAFDVKADAAGNIYVARDAQLLKLTPDGQMTLIADSSAGAARPLTFAAQLSNCRM